MLKPEIWVSDLQDDEDSKGDGTVSIEARVPLVRIREKSLIGSYTKGVIPIRSASFSSGYQRSAKEDAKIEVRRSQSSRSQDVSPEITVHLIDERKTMKSEEEEISHRKVSELLHKFDVESSKLTRAASESRKVRGHSKQEDETRNIRRSLQHLHLEERMPNAKVNDRQKIAISFCQLHLFQGMLVHKN